MRQKPWVYRSPKPNVPDGVKVEVEAKATELINAILKPEHIKPPPKNPKWNYIIDLKLGAGVVAGEAGAFCSAAMTAATKIAEMAKTMTVNIALFILLTSFQF
jgi:hypothetical protein